MLAENGSVVTHVFRGAGDEERAERDVIRRDRIVEARGHAKVRCDGNTTSTLIDDSFILSKSLP